MFFAISLSLFASVIDITGCVKDLGSPVFSKREAAQASLLAKGEFAIPFLKKAIISEDPEVAARAGHICNTLVQNQCRTFTKTNFSAGLPHIYGLFALPPLKLPSGKVYRHEMGEASTRYRNAGGRDEWDDDAFQTATWVFIVDLRHKTYSLEDIHFILLCIEKNCGNHQYNDMLLFKERPIQKIISRVEDVTWGLD